MSLEFQFIVPAHNCATTIRRTLASIVDDANETEVDGYEIIVVENGSSDDTYNICKEAANKDSHIKMYTSKKGVSCARNVGLDASTADWVIFIDADDKWIKGSLNKIVNDIKAYNPDLLIYGFKKDNKIVQHTKSPWICNNTEDLLKCRSWLIKRPTLRMQVWGKVYRNSVIQEGQLRFDERLKFSEDGEFLIRHTAYCKSMAVSEKAVYEYITDTESTTRNNENEVWGRKTHGYIEAMNASASYVQSEPEMIKKAFAEYVLVHLNLILVRDIFEVRRKCSWKIRNEEMRTLTKMDMFAEALRMVNLKDCMNFQLLPEFFIKTHIGFGGVLSYAKSFLNYRKERHTRVRNPSRIQC